jgi:hypothetical protein
MALNTTPPRHFRPQSERQRREVLRRIDAAENEALASEPAPLTAEPYLLRTERAQALAQAQPRPSPAPLRLIKPAPEPTLCGFGTCALTPECTRKCRYLQAHQALASSTGPGLAEREPLPKVDHQARRVVVIALLVYAASCVGFATWWLVN